jgi:hypothetical protein
MARFDKLRQDREGQPIKPEEFVKEMNIIFRQPGLHLDGATKKQNLARILQTIGPELWPVLLGTGPSAWPSGPSKKPKRKSTPDLKAKRRANVAKARATRLNRKKAGSG